jgi:hypothetical protein
MIHMKHLLIAIFLLVIAQAGLTQAVTLPFEHTLRIEHERTMLRQGEVWHAVYPLRVEIGEGITEYGALQRGKPGINNKALRARLNRKLFYESLIQIDTAGLKLTIDPLVLFEAGREFVLGQPIDEGMQGSQVAQWFSNGDGRKTWVNTRGIRIDGSIGSNVAFHSAFFESQAVLPTWVDAQTRELRLVPGQAMYKTFRQTGFDYAYAEGHVSYSPSSYFNFRLGHGKNFIGDGYRSLLLSDVAFNYPYLAINTRVWNIEYVNIYSQLQDISAPKGAWEAWQKKYTTTHYLSWNIWPWLNIGLFETIVWQASDSNGQRGFDINYLNPVIFYRPVEFSLGSPDNALLGGSMRFTIRKRNMLYFQLMLDEFKLEHVLKGDGWWANKHGFQIGAKSFDPFGMQGLFVQAEYNHVRPYTYSHNMVTQNYGHYNQPLAHPQGANFREVVLLANQRTGRWQFAWKMVYAVYGADTNGLNYGHNLYKPYYLYVTEFNNKIGQGLKTHLFQNDLSAGWIINPATNLSLSVGATFNHRFSDAEENNGVHLWFGMRSAVFNRYYDF